MASKLSLGTPAMADVTIDYLSFAVPAQRFRISANVTTAGHINVVLEFALRLLHTVGAISADDLQGFFGFNPRETAQLVDEMLRLDLADEIDGELMLGKAAKEAFRQTGHEPRLVKIERLEATVGFDKVAFCLADSVGSKEPHVRSLPVLQIEDRARASRAFEVVREEFQRSFKEFATLRSKTSEEWSDRTHIYSVEEVEPKGHFQYELQIPLMLRLGTDPKVEPDFTELENKGRPGSRKQLIAAATKAASAVVPPLDGAAALDVVSEFDQGLLTRFRGAAVISPDTWAKYLGAGRKVADKHQPAVLLCGSALVQATRDVLLGWAAEHEPTDVPGTGMIWLRPCIAHWGRSGDFWELAGDLKARTPDGTGLTLITALPSFGLSPTELRKIFSSSADKPGPFARAIGTRSDDLPGALELLLNPGRWVLVLVHLPMDSGGPPVPIGFCSAALDVVHSAQRALASRLFPFRGDERVLWRPQEETDSKVQDILKEALSLS